MTELNIKVGVTNEVGPAFDSMRKRVSAFVGTATAGFAKVSARLGSAARFMTRTAMAAGRMGRAVSLAGRGFLGIGRLAGRLGSILRGALMGGMIAVTGAAFGLRSAFGAMYDAMEGTTGGLGAAQEQAEGAASGLSDAADAGAEAAQKMQGVFGAFGAVAEGFVQRQGQMAAEVETAAGGALTSAQAAVEGMDAAQESIGGATQATTRFGRAANRISAAFARAKQIIFQAIAKAITPALEKLADLMESPQFKKFVDLLAKDLAKAAAAIAKWFIDKVIPALLSFMEKVSAAGGPVEYLKQKWNELKTTVMMIIAILLAKLLEWSNAIRAKFRQTIDAVKSIFESLGDAVQIVWDRIAGGAETAMTGAADAIRGAVNLLLAALETAINAAIRVLRPFIAMYNAVAEAAGGNRIDDIPTVSLPRLAEGVIAMQPMAAIVGDSPGGEAVVPLDRLPGIIRDAFGGAVGGIHIGQIVVPPGTTDPVGFGQRIGDGIVMELRRSGQRVML